MRRLKATFSFVYKDEKTCDVVLSRKIDINKEVIDIEVCGWKVAKYVKSQMHFSNHFKLIWPYCGRPVTYNQLKKTTLLCVLEIFGIL